MTNEAKRGKHLRGIAKKSCLSCDVEFITRFEFIRHHVQYHTTPRIIQVRKGRRHGITIR